tara:strand:- start:943 stop:1065 length:123 start_codon:yes stop_codon:yes gene_type:complete
MTGGILNKIYGGRKKDRGAEAETRDVVPGGSKCFVKQTTA